MDNAVFERRINESIAKMPALPVTVGKVVEIANKQGTSPVDLNKVVSMDPVLTARVLRLVNSAYYGLSTRVTTLVRAIIMLGVNTVKNLALSAAVLDNLGKAEHFDALEMQGYWRHCLGVGAAGKNIFQKNWGPPDAVEEYFIAGLLHDIGKIPLNSVAAEAYIESMMLADRGRKPLYQTEKDGLGMDHLQVGELIARNWSITENLIDAIVWHHNPLGYNGVHTRLVYVVATANYFVNIAGLGYAGDRYPETLPNEVYHKLGITADYLDEIEDSIAEQISKAEVFLRVTKGTV